MRPVGWVCFRLACRAIRRYGLALVQPGPLVLVLHLVLAPVAAFAATSASLLEIDHADFVRSASLEPPPDTAAWQPQVLPDDWLVSRPGTWRYGWYRMHLVLPAEPDRLYALFVPLLQTSAAVYVNGVHVGQVGTFERHSPEFQSPAFLPGRGLF